MKIVKRMTVYVQQDQVQDSRGEEERLDKEDTIHSYV